MVDAILHISVNNKRPMGGIIFCFVLYIQLCTHNLIRSCTCYRCIPEVVQWLSPRWWIMLVYSTDNLFKLKVYLSPKQSHTCFTKSAAVVANLLCTYSWFMFLCPALILIQLNVSCLDAALLMQSHLWTSCSVNWVTLLFKVKVKVKVLQCFYLQCGADMALHNVARFFQRIW